MNNHFLVIILKAFSVLSFVIMDVLIKKLSDYFQQIKLFFLTNEIFFYLKQ